jgi:ribosomal protein L1
MAALTAVATAVISEVSAAWMPACLACAVGNATMTDEELKVNIMMSINFLISLLKKGQHNLKSVNIKSTMSKAVKIL